MQVIASTCARGTSTAGGGMTEGTGGMLVHRGFSQADPPRNKISGRLS
jgi:hypothetical protein